MYPDNDIFNVLFRPEKTFLFFDTCTPLDDVTPWCYTRTEVFNRS